MQRQGERPTVSRTPGTTLGLIQLRAFRRSATSPVFASLYDTPGATQNQRVAIETQMFGWFFHLQTWFVVDCFSKCEE